MRVQIKQKVITIDGPGGVGKGVASRYLARKLGWNYLDSGVLYRLCAHVALTKDIPLDDIKQLTEIAKNLNIRFSNDPSEEDPCIWLDNAIINKQIRTERCGKAASKIATIPAVREVLLKRQRAFLTDKGLIADGRDMGTVVFSEAPLKFYLTASAKERAKRRQKQLQELGQKVAFEQLLTEIRQRDQRDQKRPISPLIPAEEAILLDTTEMSIDEVTETLIKAARRVFA